MFKRIIIGLYLTAAAAAGPLFAVPATLHISFYGHDISANFDAQLKPFDNEVLIQSDLLYAALKKKQIADYRQLGTELDREAKRLNLDDLGYTRLLYQWTEQNLSSWNRAQKNFLRWYLLKRKGFDALLTYGTKHLQVYACLAFATEGTKMIRDRGRQYVNLEFYKELPVTYEKIFLQPVKMDSTMNAISFNAVQVPALNALSGRKALKFTYNSKKLGLNGRYNLSLMNYYADLPVITLGPVFMQPGFTGKVKTSVIDTLKLWCTGKTKIQGLGLMLSFVQNAIAYKADRDYLSREKHNFPEETLFSEYADCEDKAMLMAALSKEVYGLNSILIYNESMQHVAMGIEVPKEAAMFSFIYKGKKYLYMEPAFSGLKPGESKLPAKNPGTFIEI